MPFGMGFGELVLLLLIAGVVIGATRLPGAGLGDWLRNASQLDPPQRNRRRWTLGEWALFASTLGLAACVIGTFVSRHWGAGP